MADSDKTVAYGITADESGFVSSMQRSASGAGDAAQSIVNSFAKVQEVVKGVQEHFVALSVVLAGGKVFKESLNETIKFNGEAMKLARTLGISASEASKMNVALGDVYSDADSYTAAAAKLGRQLRENEVSLNAMGLKTRESNGEYRNLNAMMLDSIQVINGYKQGTDRNLAATVLWGRSAAELSSLLKLNTEVVEEAEAKQKSLGLVVGEENVAAQKKYKAAMNDVGDVMLAFKKSIGDALMPVLTRLGEWFSEIAPPLVFAFSVAMKAISSVVQLLVGWIDSLTIALGGLLHPVMSLGRYVRKIIEGDIAGAIEESKKTWGSYGDVIEDSAKRADKAWSRTLSDVKDQWGAPTQKAEGDTTGTKSYKGDGKQNHTSQWDAELAEKKLKLQEQNNIDGTFYQMSKADELAFWRDKLKSTHQGTEENIAVRKKAADVELAINQEKYNAEVAGLQAQEAAFKQNVAARLGLLENHAAIVKQRYGEESKEYQAVQKDIVIAHRQAAEQQKQIDMQMAESKRNMQLIDLEIERQGVQLDRDLHAISNLEAIESQRQLEEKRIAIQRAALLERLQIAEADPDRNIAQISQIHLQIEELERQHQARIKGIDMDATREKMKFVDGAYKSMESGFASVIQKGLQGGLTMKTFYAGMWQAVTQAVTGALAQMAAQWLMQAVIGKAISNAKALSEVTANAGVAGAAAVASTAAIPIVGPAMAPAAGAAAFATAMSFAPSASAAQGYDIPSTINPLVQTHASEMILPAKHADVIRGLADNPQSSQTSAPNVSLHVHATDAHSVKRLFMGNQDALVSALSAAYRNGIRKK
jgi:hypothetical protein